jgi:predicted membrane-bound spermidine synthase
MGYSFTLSQVIIQDKFEEVGRKVGWLQFMNIVGSTLGAWFATLVGFEYLGSALTIKIICLIGLIYIVVLYKNKFQSVLTNLSLAIFLILSIYFIPKQEQFWMNLSGMKNAEDFVFHEDETALSSIKIDGEKAEVFINGLGQSILPIFHDYIHFMLGAVPAFVHPNPEDIGIIGLGSGSTLFNSGGRELTKTLDCFEVIVNQPIVVNEYVKRTKDSAAHFILTDKRVNLFLEDGRNALFRSNKLYDIVEADALRPRSSYSGNLYSVEYFTMLKSKLKKGGIAISWVPSDRIRNGFMRVFPYVYEIQETLFLGSETPIEFDTETILNRIENDYSRNYYAKAKVDVKGIMINSLKTLKVIQSGTLTTTGEHNSDMWPRDEYQRR